MWVDSYGASFSRDIEPSVEGGDRIWQVRLGSTHGKKSRANAHHIKIRTKIVVDVIRESHTRDVVHLASPSPSLDWLETQVAASCVQLYKANKTCRDEPMSPCCSLEDKHVFGNVWSLTAPGGIDNLATTDENEKDVLVQQGWKENCSPITGPSVFCVDGSESDGRNGPFLLFNTSLPDTRSLYRCITPETKHFMSTDAQCEGAKTESLMGYIATAPGNDTVRALRRCRSTATTGSDTVYFHALDLACDINDSLILGWVR